MRTSLSENMNPSGRPARAGSTRVDFERIEFTSDCPHRAAFVDELLAKKKNKSPERIDRKAEEQQHGDV